MHNYEFGSRGGTGQYSSERYTPAGDPDRRGDRSILGLVVMVAVAVLVAMVGLGFAFWALGLFFHLLGFILRVALLTAVVAFVWRRVVRGRSRGCV
jgi:hypothetical protein